VKHKWTAIISAFLLTLSLAACAQEQGRESEAGTASATAEVTAQTIAAAGQSVDEQFTGRDYEVGYSDYVTIALSDGGSTADGDGVCVAGNTVTISGEGSYLLTGSLSDGQIVVNADESAKIQLVLAGVTIASSDSAPIYIMQADKVFLTLADGTENSLSAAGEYIQTDDNNVDAAIFSQADLTLNGSGSLQISSAYGHGVVSKDDLAVTGGSYEITAASHGISGKDSVRIAGGSFIINAGKDGIHAENADDADMGYVYIAGGSFTIISAGDGIDATGTLQIEDGDFSVTAGGGSADVVSSGGGDFRNDWGQQSATEDSDDTASTKGLKADGGLTINGGSINIDAYDDALHTNADAAINGGELQVSCGDDGIHADISLAISGGSLNVAKCYEGLEAQSIDISGGTITLVCSDDGLNASDGSGGDGGFSGSASTAGLSVNISDGTLMIDADGDGIDSNGSLTVSGGEVYISGPTSSNNGAMDYQGTGSITGGVIVAAGSTGMAMNFDSGSTQGSILYNLTAAVSAGTEITLTDGSGSVLAQYTPDKQFQSVLVSAPGIVSGATYTLTVGSDSYSIEMTSLLYGSGGGLGGGGGMPDGGAIGGGMAGGGSGTGGRPGGRAAG
jgi:hypothetical protein